MSIRTERVAERIQREVADILQKDFAGQLQPMVTITHARVTKDLSIAYVYASVLGQSKAERQAAFRHLEELAPQVRQALAVRVRDMRTVPELKFFLDESYQEAQRMSSLLDRIREERERRTDAGEDDAVNEPDAVEGSDDA